MAYSTNILTQITSDPALQPFLPFFFVLAVIFGTLSVANIFKRRDGRPMNSVNFMIALVFAFFAAGYQPFVNFFFLNFGLVVWAFVGIFFIAFILEAIGLRGRKKIPAGKENLPIMMITIFILLLATFGFTYISKIEIPVVGTENFMIILSIILLIAIFYYAYEHGRSGREEQYLADEIRRKK